MNTWRAKKIMKQNLPKINEILAYYKNEFKRLVTKLERTKELEKKAEITHEICENVGLKYVVALKYNDYFKNVNQCSIKLFRDFLGIKLFEHYDGRVEITAEKIEKLTKLYKDILKDGSIITQTDLALKIQNKEVEVIK